MGQYNAEKAPWVFTLQVEWLMFRIIDQYISKIISNATLTALFTLVSLSMIIRFIDQLRRIGQGSYSAFNAGLFTLLSIPKDIEFFFPMATLIGTLLGLSLLATRNELIVMQASGFSQIQIAGAAVKNTVLIVLITMAIGEWVVPFSEQIAYRYRNRAIYGSSISSTEKGLWIKDGNSFVFIEHILTNNVLAGVNIYHFNDKTRLKTLCHAKIAIFSKGKWKLLQTDESDLTNEKQIISRKNINIEWKTNLTPDKLAIITLEPSSMSISGLLNYTDYLKKNGQEYRRYKLYMWRKIFVPFSVIVMVLMALSFIFSSLYNVTMRGQIIIGISCSFFFYVLDQIFGLLSLMYSISPILGALLPSMIFFSISILLLIRH